MDQVNQSLAEQLHINDREIEKRKALLDFTDTDAKALKSFKPLVTKYIDGIVKNFYEHITQDSGTTLLIGDSETMLRLENSMRRYILELFDGYYDSDYVNRRLRIGKVHMRIGLAPKYYLAAIHQLKDVVYQAIAMHYFGRMNEDGVRDLQSALNKLLMFDIQLVFDTYIYSLVSEVNIAKDELEEYTSSLEETINQRTRQLHDLSRKDELTELFNQRGFYEHLRRELANAERYSEPLTLVYFDLNGFKILNDTHGHKEGDAVLFQVGQIMLMQARESDIACRYGGDEFCLILPRTTITEAKNLCERIIEAHKQETKNEISFSIGIAMTGSGEICDADTLVRRADEKMYIAKSQSKIKPGYYIQCELSEEEESPVDKADTAEFSITPVINPKPANSA
ncbi:MAG: GGDEF domain-containing protein [Gammaproteobacteria bacterium]|nr:GGDEF domain-containing protein [Gammaproteobacteria bacterium]MDH5777757.1 GGDEF domain-containing protein [Gammaproteobacteria bacterium]